MIDSISEQRYLAQREELADLIRADFVHVNAVAPIEGCEGAARSDAVEKIGRCKNMVNEPH